MAVPFTNVSGSATIGTAEFSLPANTTAAVPTSQTTAIKKPYVVLDRIGATVAGEQFNLAIYEKVNGGTQRVLATFAMVGATTELDVFELPPIAEGWDITLKKITGTDRAIGFSIREDVGDVNALTAGAAAVTSIQSGLATAAAVAAVAASQARLLSVMNENSMLDNATYNGNGLLTAGRVRGFANAGALAAAVAGHADGADGEVYRWILASTDGGAGKPSVFTLARAL